MIPVHLFRPCRAVRRTNTIENSITLPTNSRLPAQILCSVFSQNWINVNIPKVVSFNHYFNEVSFQILQVHDILHFLPSDEPDVMKFIFATEETGYRHLYLYTVQLASSHNKASIIDGKEFFKIPIILFQ